MTETDQSGMLSRNNSSVYNSAESGSTLIASQRVGGVLENELLPDEHTSTDSLLPSLYEDAVPDMSVDDRTSESPSSGTSLFQCMCCCYITTNVVHEDRTRVNYKIHYLTELKYSNFILFGLTVLMSIPISSIYYGVTYKESCPMIQFLPVLLILMGVMGIIFIVVHIFTISARRCLRRVKEPSKVIPISLTFMLMVCMIMEMITVYTRKPVFDNPKDPVFCEKALYDYVFYMNFVVLVIVILALLLHNPTKPRSAERIEAPERFDAI